MSFLSRIKELGKPREEDEVQPEALSTEGMVVTSGARTVDTQSASPSTLQPSMQADSVISEAAPSEFPPDYLDNRLKADPVEDGVLEPQSGLPLIGHLGLDRQQRLLGGALAVGVLGLVLSAFLSVTRRPPGRPDGGNRSGADAVAEAGESVSQALVGRAQAFSEVQDSVKVLATNVRGLAQGDSKAGLSEVPGGAREP